jgi:hypothetical protein
VEPVLPPADPLSLQAGLVEQSWAAVSIASLEAAAERLCAAIPELSAQAAKGLALRATRVDERGTRVWGHDPRLDARHFSGVDRASFLHTLASLRVPVAVARATRSMSRPADWAALQQALPSSTEYRTFEGGHHLILSGGNALASWTVGRA